MEQPPRDGWCRLGDECLRPDDEQRRRVPAAATKRGPTEPVAGSDTVTTAGGAAKTEQRQREVAGGDADAVADDGVAPGCRRLDRCVKSRNAVGPSDGNTKGGAGDPGGARPNRTAAMSLPIGPGRWGGSPFRRVVSSVFIVAACRRCRAGAGSETATHPNEYERDQERHHREGGEQPCLAGVALEVGLESDGMGHSWPRMTVSVMTMPVSAPRARLRRSRRRAWGSVRVAARGRGGVGCHRVDAHATLPTQLVRYCAGSSPTATTAAPRRSSRARPSAPHSIVMSPASSGWRG